MSLNTSITSRKSTKPGKVDATHHNQNGQIPTHAHAIGNPSITSRRISVPPSNNVAQSVPLTQTIIKNYAPVTQINRAAILENTQRDENRKEASSNTDQRLSLLEQELSILKKHIAVLEKNMYELQNENMQLRSVNITLLSSTNLLMEQRINTYSQLIPPHTTQPPILTNPQNPYAQEVAAIPPSSIDPNKLRKQNHNTQPPM